jgi:hypothetical protein
MAQGVDWRQLQSMAAIMKPCHPELEQEADIDAFRWMVAAGYDPRELAHLWRVGISNKTLRRRGSMSYRAS